MTHFSWVDGGIVGLYLLATMTVGIVVRKHVVKVEHFLVAGREMNVYLGIASLAATEFGIVTCMYTAQNGRSPIRIEGRDRPKTSLSEPATKR